MSGISLLNCPYYLVEYYYCYEYMITYDDLRMAHYLFEGKIEEKKLMLH